MTNHAAIIAALRIPMDVTLPSAPELDEYDEQRKAAADALDVDVIEQSISDVAHEGGSVREQAEYVLKCIATRQTSEVWAEATAAAYGAAQDIAKSWFHNVGKGTPYAEIEALTPQSARDWLAAHDAEVYRRGQEDMRERAARIAYQWWFDGHTAIETALAIRTIPIKEKDDE